MIDDTMKNCQILLVDDEQSELDAYSLLLMSMGIANVRTLSDSRRVLATLADMKAPVVFLDLNMPHMSGQDVLRELKVKRPQVPVIVITANSEIETAVECLRLGAHDYLVKPIDLKMFSSALRNALEIGLLRNEVLSLKGIHFDRAPHANPAFSPIITKNPAMFGIFRYIESIAASGLPTLILGETGSGKELIARAIHQVSGLSGEFVAVDISGLDDTLFSDTLFGHTRGAYTGAETTSAGPARKGRRRHHLPRRNRRLERGLPGQAAPAPPGKYLLPARLGSSQTMPGPDHHRRQQGSDLACRSGGRVPHGSLLPPLHPPHPAAAAARAARGHPAAGRPPDHHGGSRHAQGDAGYQRPRR